MGLFDKLEQKLERTVNGAFAKAFRAEVQPVEIASAMRRAMDDRAASIDKGQRPIVPNVFSVELSQTDFDRLTAYRQELSDELVASAMEHADVQRYTPGGPVAVTFARGEELETGVFRIRPSTAKNVDALKREEAAAAYDASQVDPGRGSGLDTPSASAPGYSTGGGGQSAPGYSTGGGGQNAPGYSGGERQGTHSQNAAPTGHAYQSPTQNAHHAPTGQAPAGPAAPGYPAGSDRPGPDAPDYARPPQPQPAPERKATPPPVARNPKDRPWLDIDGERYPILGAITIIGRDDEADVILDDPGISRQHSEIRVTHDGPHLVVSIRDLGSTNGTYVNGDPVSRARLVEGDRLTIGRTTFIIHMGGRR